MQFSRILNFFENKSKQGNMIRKSQMSLDISKFNKIFIETVID